MRVLVACASKYGSTREIAGAIGAALRERGHVVTVCSFHECSGVEGYDAAVLGGAAYAGHWPREGPEFIARHAPALSAIPVWLFSSGPIGDPLKPDDDHAVDVADLLRLTEAREHRLFAGKLDKKHLSFPERALVAAFRVAEGDYRDWDAIRNWAASIADALDAETTR